MMINDGNAWHNFMMGDAVHDFMMIHDGS